jgi:hypothetical protein
MAENITLEFLGAQFERMFEELRSVRADQASMRDDIRVLTTIVLRHDGTLNAILDQLHALTMQHNRFNDRLRRLEDQPAE